jgi:hypothetical protein
MHRVPLHCLYFLPVHYPDVCVGIAEQLALELFNYLDIFIHAHLLAKIPRPLDERRGVIVTAADAASAI